MIGVRFNIFNQKWVRQVGSYVVFKDERLGEISIFGKLVYADDSTAVVKNSDAVIVSRTGYFSSRALEIYEKLKNKIDGEETKIDRDIEGEVWDDEIDDNEGDFYDPEVEKNEEDEEDWDEEEFERVGVVIE